MSIPKDLTPINIKAFLSNTFGMCGCSEFDEVIKVLIKILELIDKPNKQVRWHKEEFGNEAGFYYIIAGILDEERLIDHGTAIRYPWLTDDGKRFLEAIKNIKPEEVEMAEGEAYDGVVY